MGQKDKLSQVSLIQKSISYSFGLISQKPIVIMPFGVITILELLGLLMIFVAVQPPLVKFITPVILRFFGPQFLHYPFNLLLLSQLFFYLQLLIEIIIGTFMAGLIISVVQQHSQNKAFSLKAASMQALVKYISLIIITILVFAVIQYSYSIEKKALLKVIMKGPAFLGIRQEDWAMLSVAFGIIMSGIIQGIFIFAQPIVIINKENFIVAIFKNFYYVAKNLIAALILVILPMCAYIPIAILKANLFLLMKKTFPEIVFLVLVCSVFISLFINLIVTISTTRAYLLVRGNQEEEIL